MGSRILYWLLVINLATSSGWIFLLIHYLKIKFFGMASGCLIMVIYFLLFCFIQYDTYMDDHSLVHHDIIYRLIISILGLLATFLFVKDTGKYERK